MLKIIMTTTISTGIGIQKYNKNFGSVIFVQFSTLILIAISTHAAFLRKSHQFLKFSTKSKEQGKLMAARNSQQ